MLEEHAYNTVLVSLNSYVCSRSRNDNQGRECIILNGRVETNIQDDKKNFVFSLSCTGVQEMFFSVEDEEMYYEWVTKLQTACNSGRNFSFYCNTELSIMMVIAGDYAHALQAESDEPTAESSQVDTSRIAYVSHGL